MARGHLGTIGGHLTLTNQRVVFEPHMFNLKRGSEVFNLDDIVSVSDALWVVLRDGRKVRFVVTKPKVWREALSPNVEPASPQAAASASVAPPPAAEPEPVAPPPTVEKPTETTKPSAPTTSQPNVIDQLKRLHELHRTGVLTDAEFESKKAELLDRL